VLDGALTKRMGPGLATKGGITAALMAERGITGAKNCLEGRFGMYNLYHQGSYDAKVLTADLGKHFEGINVSIKPYPCCRGIHASVDAALALASKYNIKPDEVKEIKIFCGEAHYSMLATPLEIKCKPRNAVDSQFSIPWGVATAIARGRVGIKDFTEEAIKSHDILEVSSKISVELDSSLNRSSRGVEPGRVRITMKNGRVYSEQIDDPLGSPQRPMTFSDCARKFRDCATYQGRKLPDRQIEKIIELIGQLEHVEDIVDIIKLLS